MICSKILLNKDLFCNVSNIEEVLERIKSGERPKLPSICQELTKLIEDCWRSSPSKLPKFVSICKRLMKLKNFFLIESVVNTPNFNSRREWIH